MKKLSFFLPVALAALLLAGCNTQKGPAEQAGPFRVRKLVG